MEDAIFTRVSIREFTDESVSDEQVERLMGGRDGGSVGGQPAAMGVRAHA